MAQVSENRVSTVCRTVGWRWSYARAGEGISLAAAKVGVGHWRQKTSRNPPLKGSLNLSQFVEGRRWCPWAREGLEEAHVFAGDEPGNGEEIHHASTRFYA